MTIPRPKVAKQTSQSKCQKRKKSNEGRRRQKTSPLVNKQKKTVRLKNISTKAGSKWQPVPKTLGTTILSMLDDSISPFTDSGNKAVERILHKIRDSVQHTLEEVRVPKVTWTDSKSLKTSQKLLLAEKKRLEDLEVDLSLTLDEEVRQTKLLQIKRDRLKSSAASACDQPQVILQTAQEST
ncbi:unnamed protein product [Candidula unifasciata]|uniref:Centromere protein Q n=1 Tax=Candidula unifasciata TaxID=100452 RepID=A0A8S3YXF8_9EUPU|nr:unnamed protein product [Candidula unifasciata]